MQSITENRFSPVSAMLLRLSIGQDILARDIAALPLIILVLV
jgi:hypothetical protein